MLNFADEDVVVAAVQDSVFAALEDGQAIVQERHSRCPSSKGNGKLLVVAGIPAREVIGDTLLPFGENTDTELVGRGQSMVAFGLSTDTDQEQHRVQRHRRYGVGGHAMHTSVDVSCDDSDSGGKVANNVAELA